MVVTDRIHPFFLVAVVALAFGDWGRTDLQLAQQSGQLCPLVVVRPGAGGAVPGAVRQGPGVPSADTSVGDGFAVAVEDGHAPPGSGMLRGARDQVAGGVGVEQAEPRYLGGRV
jgi:hypothetical protein